MIRLSLSNPKSLDDKLLHMLNIKSLRLLSYKFSMGNVIEKKKEKKVGSWKFTILLNREKKFHTLSYFPTFN